MSLSTALEAVKRIEDDLFVTTLPNGIEIIFRLPSYFRAEQYYKLLQSASSVGLQNIVYEALFKEYIEDEYLANFDNDLPAGIPESIAQVILFLSGAGNDNNQLDYTEELLKLYRSETRTFTNTMKRFICAAFPGYKISDINALNYQELVKVFTQAERWLIEQGIIEEEIRLIRPGEEVEKPFKVEDVIRDDQRAFEKFENTMEGNLRHPYAKAPAEMAQEEEQRFRQVLAQRYAAQQGVKTNPPKKSKTPRPKKPGRR